MELAGVSSGKVPVHASGLIFIGLIAFNAIARPGAFHYHNADSVMHGLPRLPYKRIKRARHRRSTCTSSLPNKFHPYQ